MNRVVAGALAVAVVLVGLAVGVLAGTAVSPAASAAPSTPGIALASPSVVPSTPAPAGSPSGTTPPPTPSATPLPTPTPTPGPVLVPAPLTGVLVPEAVADRHPVAVMVDDLSPARPQSGFSAASVVWQAPAEGGIPRYMMVFQENIPGDVGPVRSSRYYYIAWAAELRAVYAHAGGSPQALATLKAKGGGQLVYNADEFRWGGSFRRSASPPSSTGAPRFGPHNLYTTGKQLRALVTATGAKDGPIAWPWTFAADAPLAERPVGGRIQVTYQANVIRYDYNRATNTYLRSVSVEGKEYDGSTKQRVAPKNVIVMQMVFGPLNDGEYAKKHRLEAQVVGSGKAWISTNGVTIKGTWRKPSLTAPTRFFDSQGNPVTLTVGQTFIQVMKTTDPITFVAGKPAPLPLPGPGRN
ncbi:MAG TPA: DUF3048 domain-containing protein [Candidatus Limnocylindrales bacterium]|nr:DUF3048 domain-containing protein [Candidatus Limnocylindrales bacterium]